VSSNTHENITTKGKPITPNQITIEGIDSGKCSAGTTTPVTSETTQPSVRYVALTLKTLRRLSSLISEKG